MGRYDLIAIDEVGYVPLAEVGAEFLFQVIAERAERSRGDCDNEPGLLRVDPGDSKRAALQGTLDRITDRAHILETGTESYRFRRTVTRKKGNPKEG